MTDRIKKVPVQGEWTGTCPEEIYGDLSGLQNAATHSSV